MEKDTIEKITPYMPKLSAHGIGALIASFEMTDSINRHRLNDLVSEYVAMDREFQAYKNKVESYQKVMKPTSITESH